MFHSICALLIFSSAAALAEPTATTTAFAPLDRAMEEFMKARGTPGGALAVVKNGRLVYAKGFGWADRERGIAVKPDSLFRIASVSKCFTAVAVMKLIEEGRLNLEAKAFDLLSSGAGWQPAKKQAGYQPAPLDPRLQDITINMLLHHTTGWDSKRSFDPMFRPKTIAEAVGVPCPPKPEAIVRYMMGQRLDFDPGARYAYSDFGYSVLGRVIEAESNPSHPSYESYVQNNILSPIGITRMRIGASLIEGRAEGEVRYYTARNTTGLNVCATAPETVPAPYGTFCVESFDAHGGWIASVVDLARFAAALDDAEHSRLLKPETIRLMSAPPDPPVSRNEDGSLKDSYYGCGWQVRPVGKPGKANYWHSGSIPGTFSYLVRRADGISWAALFNQRSDKKDLPDNAIDPMINRALKELSMWPNANLFGNFN